MAQKKDASLHADLESLRIERGATEAPRPRPRRRRRWIVIALALLAAGWVIVRALVARPVPVTVAKAVRIPPGEEASVPVLSGSGYVVTGDRYVSLGVRVPGRIERYFVEEGQGAHQGDPLVQIDDRDYRAAVQSAQAALDLARANLALAEADLARGKVLKETKVISSQEYDVLVNKAAVARATVAQAEAQLNQARVNLDYTVVQAPTDGVILAKFKEVGEIAVPGGFAGSGDLIRMANLSEMRAEVDINESDLSRVRMGQKARVTPDAYPDAHYEAEVVKFYPQVDRQKGTNKVEVRILNPDQRLLPDMSARITFLDPLPPAKTGGPQVTVPPSAVRSRDGMTFVWVVRDGRVRRTRVETAGAVGERVRIVSGLEGGEDVVVSEDDSKLRDGVKVAAGS